MFCRLRCSPGALTDRFDELDDRVLRISIVPRGQWVVTRVHMARPSKFLGHPYLLSLVVWRVALISDKGTAQHGGLLPPLAHLT